MHEFLPGLELCEKFYQEVVRPRYQAEFAGLPHAAALLGPGSEVLGFDTEMSTDHDWGPRVLLFLREEDRTQAEAVRQAIAGALPARFRGFSTAAAPQPVRVTTPRAFVEAQLGFDLSEEIEPADWLTFPEQKLLEITAGAVYHDEIGLGQLRARFRYYPHDVWLYLLAAAWTRIGQEQHLLGRAGSVGDELGAAVLAARLARDGMRLAFLLERRYAPYPKWLGTAFQRLSCAPDLGPALLGAVTARGWREREALLCSAFARLAELQNGLEITEPVPARIIQFYDRPFRVLEGDFVGALRDRIVDPRVRALTARRLIGSIDQVSDNTDLLFDPAWRRHVRKLYSPDAEG